MSKHYDLPVIDLDVFVSQERDSDAVIKECKRATEALIVYGALVLHDSRASEQDNVNFLDLMEDYFNQPETDIMRDARPELGFQVGVTLENTERPKCAVDEPCLKIIKALEPSERPLDISAHAPDPKCRFFWRMGQHPPYETQFPSLNAPNVIPSADFLKDRWEHIMNRWGNAMSTAVGDLADMLSIGLDLPPETFRNAGQYGPHLLAPTASDFTKYGTKDTILSGFHTDLNFLTIHGRSRYPGLHIWARNTGKRISVRIPDGNNLLVQAGKQLEHISGGLIKAGFHEVVVNEQTLAAIEKRKLQFPHRPIIRISSTFFWHLSSDYDLHPIPRLVEKAQQFRVGKNDGEEVNYPLMKVGQQVASELKHIALMA